MPRPLEHTTCAVEGCKRPHKAHGYCASHYQQFRRGEAPKALIPREYDHGTVCSVAGCGKPEKAKGLCGTHYKRLTRHGDPSAVHKPWDMSK